MIFVWGIRRRRGNPASASAANSLRRKMTRSMEPIIERRELRGLELRSISSAGPAPPPQPGIEAQQVTPGGGCQDEGQEDEPREDVVGGVEEGLLQEMAVVDDDEDDPECDPGFPHP